MFHSTEDNSLIQFYLTLNGDDDVNWNYSIKIEFKARVRTELFYSSKVAIILMPYTEYRMSGEYDF